METVTTLSQFLSELENHLLIFPDKQGIKQLQLCLNFYLNLKTIFSSFPTS